MAVIFERVTVCGVGLIGGSLAARARALGLVGRVHGFGRRPDSLQVALERNLVDEVSTDPAQAAAGAQLVVLAVPLMAMPRVLGELLPYLPADTIITDVGSVKQWVIEQLEPGLGSAMALVAAHPVAGKESAGPTAADPELFIGRRVIVTPSRCSTPLALERVERLWRGVGAQVERMSALLHDQILARVSHLPQILSSALGAALEDELVGGRFAAAYGAGGLRDMSRLAGSPADIWRDICLTNRAPILEALAGFENSLTRLRHAIEHHDSAELEALFEQGRRIVRHLGAGAPTIARPRPVIAIDGPMGAGKSTVARMLAAELGFTYLNTGAMYRAVAVAAQRSGLAQPPYDEAAISALLATIEIGFEGERVLLDGEDISGLIGAPEVGELASTLSTLSSVRERMGQLQRAAGAGGGVVMEGRDIGTAIFPDAEYKFFLDADPEVRAARRWRELAAAGQRITLEEVRLQLRQRDRRDAERALAPLRCAADAILLDSTHLSLAGVVATLKAAIAEHHQR
ncbi:MAG TPA: (d)CMP kinase [Candidatus Binataceae bacterium]|nr:(d)CMP kinase [Candidatus Binataceae bacterium]